MSDFNSVWFARHVATHVCPRLNYLCRTGAGPSRHPLGRSFHLRCSEPGQRRARRSWSCPNQGRRAEPQDGTGRPDSGPGGSRCPGCLPGNRHLLRASTLATANPIQGPAVAAPYRRPCLALCPSCTSRACLGPDLRLSWGLDRTICAATSRRSRRYASSRSW